jgi:CheY-like chemotaxis protein
VGQQPTAGGERDRSVALPVVNVLVVDDDDDTRDLVATIIGHAGYSVEVACSGREALERLQAMRPELIFLDIQMPDLDGAEFREQQRRNRDWIQIPTVVMTGSMEEPQLDVAVKATLHKPVRARDFLALVRRYCRALADRAVTRGHE